MKKIALVFGLFFVIFSITSVLAAGSINLKLVNPVNLSSDGLVSLGNNGTIDLTNVVLSSTGLPQLNFPYNHFDMPVPPPQGGYVVVSRPHLVNPQDLRFGYNYFNITAKSNENVSASVSSSVVRSFCNNGSLGGKLIIRLANIRNEFGDITAWKLGDRILVQVKVENDENYSFDNVRVKLGIFDSEGANKINNFDFLNPEEEVISIGHLEPATAYAALFEFIVPTDFKPGDYRLAVKVYDGSSGENSQCQDTTEYFDEFYYQPISVIPAIPVYSCQELNQTNGDYVLQQDVFTDQDGLCFVVGADNVTLNLNGNTIRGLSSGSDTGVFNNGFNRFWIYNGTITYFYKGMILTDSSQSNVKDILFDSNLDTGLYIDGGGNHTLSSNRFLNQSGSESALTIQHSSNNHIADSFFVNNDEGISIKVGSGNIIERTTITNSSGRAGLLFFDSANNRIADTSITNNRLALSLDFDSSYYSIGCNQVLKNVKGDNNLPILFFNNTSNISNIYASEIILCNADYSSLKNVVVSNNPLIQSNGIFLIDTDYASISNISLNNSLGFRVEGGEHNNISGLSSAYSDWGLLLAGSNDNEITNSSFLHSSRNGIILSDSQNNTFYSNFIIDSKREEGINFEGVSFSNIFYNNFLNNSKNIHVELDQLNYYNTYMHRGKNIIGGRFLGGNFWAQPNGKGFSETCTDKNWDGLCDNPYIVNENNFDEIPLARKNRYDPQLDK